MVIGCPRAYRADVRCDRNGYDSCSIIYIWQQLDFICVLVYSTVVLQSTCLFISSFCLFCLFCLFFFSFFLSLWKFFSSWVAGHVASFVLRCLPSSSYSLFVCLCVLSLFFHCSLTARDLAWLPACCYGIGMGAWCNYKGRAWFAGLLLVMPNTACWTRDKTDVELAGILPLHSRRCCTGEGGVVVCCEVCGGSYAFGVVVVLAW